jgi:PhzF family phenazine biosynthesis protein
MTIPIYQVDAFTEKIYAGNPAAICPLQEWLPEEKMQQIAFENNLSETAFIVPEGNDYHIRWFTPTTEVALCGHATLAATFVFYRHLGYNREHIRFNSKSGWLTVIPDKTGGFTLDFPADPPEMVSVIPDNLFESLGIEKRTLYKGKFDYMVELDNQKMVANLKPDFKKLSLISSRGILVTAKGDDADIVSRCFFPQSGIDEDPVTGSAHCLLVPFWFSKTGKTNFKAIQWSQRKGWLECELKNDRVLMSGHAVLFLKGEIYLS